MDIFRDVDAVAEMASTHRGLFDRLVEWLDSFLDKLKSIFANQRYASQYSEQIAKDIDAVTKVRELFVRGLDLASLREDGAEVDEKTESDVHYSFVGTNEYGIEVYETSPAVMKMTWKERKARYLDLMKNEYKGRTAKFVRNGHTYYAIFDPNSLRKPVYGEKRSSSDGAKAFIKAGADGDVFNLVENSTYTRSSLNKKSHTDADYFDYFVKTVQIDDKVFDVIVDVEKKLKKDGGYTYTIAPDESESPRDYDKPITIFDISKLREIIKAHGGERVSVNDFTSEDIQKAQKWAYKFWDGFKKSGVNPCISPFFRAWFGDWRAYDTKTRLKFVPVNTQKISAQDVSRSGAVNRDTGWSVIVNSDGIDETANKRKKWSADYHSLKSINEMIQDAILVDTVVVDKPSKKLGNNTALVHHMYCPVSVDGEKAIAKLYITEEIGNRNKFYLTKIETVPTDSTGLHSIVSSPKSSVDTDISIADLYSFVKRLNVKFEEDSKKPTKFEPRPVNEHLLDENKEPRVFYHGTNADFTVINATNDRVVFDHKRYALGKSKDGIALYKITVEEFFSDASDPNDKRFHNLRYIEKVADSIGSLTRNNSYGAESTNDASTTIYSIADLYSLVKTYDKDFHAGKLRGFSTKTKRRGH